MKGSSTNSLHGIIGAKQPGFSAQKSGDISFLAEANTKEELDKIKAEL